MLIFHLKITPEISKRRELLNILHNVAEQTLIRMGCQACEVYEGSGEDQSVFYLEKWDSVTAIRIHIQSPLYVKILAAMEFSAVPPEIFFCETRQIWGLDLVESLRTPGKESQS